MITNACQVPAEPEDESEAVIAVLNQQAVDWSNGDIEAYMQGYWKSEELSFGGSNGFSFGWEETLAGYKQRYPSQEIMGKLEFDIIKVTRLADDVYYVLGKYMLTRNIGDASGYFANVWKKIDGDWKIVGDHTC